MIFKKSQKTMNRWKLPHLLIRMYVYLCKYPCMCIIYKSICCNIYISHVKSHI